MPTDDDALDNIKRIKEQQAEQPRNNITQLVPTKSDAELAQELKSKVEEVYAPLLALLNEYDMYGFNVQASVGKNAFGKYHIVQLQVIKVY